jgi:bile acid-coenzyme A ligase
MTTTVSYSQRLRDLAATRPDAVALIGLRDVAADDVITYAELDEAVDRAATLLAGAGVTSRSLVVVSLPDVPLHPTITYGAWRLGACVLPMSPRLPRAERERILLATVEFPHVVTVGVFAEGSPDVPIASADELAVQERGTWGDVVARPAMAIGSGGTSGTPKITIDGAPGVVHVVQGAMTMPPLAAAMGACRGQVHLVASPLFHTNGFSGTMTYPFLGDTTVLVERFDAERILRAVAQLRINQTIVVPTVLQRLIQAHDAHPSDLSSLTAVGYGGSSCPQWLARRWIDLIGAEHVYAGYGATEAIGKTVLRGDEWLEHPGSSGRPVSSELRILGEDGADLRPGEVGEVFMRPVGATEPMFRYLGGTYQPRVRDGFVSLGDIGWVDADGYLYIADRRTDLIISGGANVYPAEVEAVLTEHGAVADAAVVGLPDEEWGHRVHAAVELHPGANATNEDLTEWCRARLAPYKRPKTIVIVDELPRTEVGKLARHELVAQADV